MIRERTPTASVASSPCVGQWSPAATALVGELVATPTEGAGGQVHWPVWRLEATLEVLAGIVGGIARQDPVVFVLEDAHWIDPTTADLVHRLVALARASRLLLLITARPGYRAPFAGQPHVTTLALRSLAELTFRHWSGTSPAASG